MSDICTATTGSARIRLNVGGRNQRKVRLIKKRQKEFRKWLDTQPKHLAWDELKLWQC